MGPNKNEMYDTLPIVSKQLRKKSSQIVSSSRILYYTNIYLLKVKHKYIGRIVNNQG